MILNPGSNEICYVIDSKFHGTHKIYANLYLIDSKKPIVVSDIDGTITK